MSPYKVVDESEAYVIYEYRTAYTWTLYAILVALAAGISIPNDFLGGLAAVAAVGYFVAKLALGAKVTEQVKQAMQSGGVQISGSKVSFSNPLRIRVPR